MPRRRLALLFGVTAALLVGLGLLQSSWWTIVGGVTAAAAAAWIVTEEG